MSNLENKVKQDSASSQPTVLEVIFGLGMFVGCLSGIGFLIYQVFLYLQEGVWTSYSALHLAQYLGNRIEYWAIYPDSWLGIHRILEWLPLSAVIFFGGLWFASWCETAMEEIEKARNEPIDSTNSG